MDLYAYVYDAGPAAVRPAAAARVEAMDHSDAWVEGGCRDDDPRLEQERQALVASYTALRAAVGVQPQHPVVAVVELHPGRRGCWW